MASPPSLSPNPHTAITVCDHRGPSSGRPTLLLPERACSPHSLSSCTHSWWVQFSRRPRISHPPRPGPSKHTASTPPASWGCHSRLQPLGLQKWAPTAVTLAAYPALADCLDLTSSSSVPVCRMLCHLLGTLNSCSMAEYFTCENLTLGIG